MNATVEHDTRAEFVAGLRKLADFLEANPHLPSPVAATTYAHSQTRVDVMAFADKYGARLHEWEKGAVANWMASLELATVNDCHHVEYVMAGSELTQ